MVADQDSLERYAWVEGAAVADPPRRLPGRGAYLHPDPACLAAATRRGVWARAFRRPVGRPPGQ